MIKAPLPLNFHQPGLTDGSYVIFVDDRRKLYNFCLVIFIGQGPTEDKMKLIKKSSSVSFGLSWPMKIQQFPVMWNVTNGGTSTLAT
jgi:hypothetical protein